MRIRIVLPILLTIASISMLGQVRRPGGGNPPVGTRNTPGVFSMPTTRQTHVDIEITDENSQPLNDSQAMVEISGEGGGPQQTYANPDGRASFTVASGSSYQVTVSGEGIETATSSFEVQPGEMNHREMIAVRLRTRAGTRGPGGMVSATNLKIPAKAREEFSKGMKEMQNSKWENAKKHLEKAVKEYPSYDWAYNNLGVVEMQLKNPEAARTDFQKAVDLNDKNPDASGNLGLMKLGDNDYKEAIELFKKSLTVQPNNSKYLLMLAAAETKTGDYPAALANAEKVHRDGIDHFPYGHFLAAQLREQMGDHPGAERQYQLYLKEAPEGPKASEAKQGLQRLEASN